MRSSSPKGRGVSLETTRPWTDCQSVSWRPNSPTRGKFWSCHGDESVRPWTGSASVVCPTAGDRPRLPARSPSGAPSGTGLSPRISANQQLSSGLAPPISPTHSAPGYSTATTPHRIQRFIPLMDQARGQRSCTECQQTNTNTQNAKASSAVQEVKCDPSHLADMAFPR